MTSSDEVHAACGEACDEALAELERYLDGELPVSQGERVRTHLTACYPCTERASFEEQLRAIVRRECLDNAPATLLDRIHQRLEAGDLSA